MNRERARSERKRGANRERNKKRKRGGNRAREIEFKRCKAKSFYKLNSIIHNLLGERTFIMVDCPSSTVSSSKIDFARFEIR